jgi:hypothetical protein
MTTITGHGVWNNTSAQITTITLTASTGTYGIGSSITVL